MKYEIILFSEVLPGNRGRPSSIYLNHCIRFLIHALCFTHLALLTQQHNIFQISLSLLFTDLWSFPFPLPEVKILNTTYVVKVADTEVLLTKITKLSAWFSHTHSNFFFMECVTLLYTGELHSSTAEAVLQSTAVILHSCSLSLLSLQPLECGAGAVSQSHSSDGSDSKVCKRDGNIGSLYEQDNEITKNGINHWNPTVNYILSFSGLIILIDIRCANQEWKKYYFFLYNTCLKQLGF